MELLRIVGTSGGLGIARDLFPEDAAWMQIVIQSDTPVGDDEFNAFQQIAEMNLRHLGTGLLTDGLMSDGLAVANSGVANKFWLQYGMFLAGGFPFVVMDSRNNGTGLALKNAVGITLNAPPSGSINRVDLVFLEVWFEEVASTGQANASVSQFERGGWGNAVLTNNILNTYLGTETARRVQLRWRIRVVDNATSVTGQTAWGGVNANASGRTFALVDPADNLYRAGNVDGTVTTRTKGTTGDAATFKSVNGFVYALPLFTVLRRPSDTVIVPGDLLTTPPRCMLKVLVPRGNIVPPVSDGNETFPINLLYEGTVAYSVAGSGVTENRLDTQSLAAKVTIPFPSGSPVTSVEVTRATLRLARRGSAGLLGTDLLVELVADAGGEPTGSVVGSFLLPKEWLTAEVRNISVPLRAVVTYGSVYWLRVTRAGDGVEYVVWVGEAASNPDRTNAQATTGAVNSAWPTTMPPLYVAVYTGADGSVRNIVEGTPVVSATMLEYLSDDVRYVADVEYTSTGAKDSADLVEMVRAAGGSIVQMRRINPA